MLRIKDKNANKGSLTRFQLLDERRQLRLYTSEFISRTSSVGVLINDRVQVDDRSMLTVT